MPRLLVPTAAGTHCAPCQGAASNLASNISQRRSGCVAAFWLAIFTPMNTLKMPLPSLCSPAAFLFLPGWLSKPSLLVLGANKVWWPGQRCGEAVEVSWSRRLFPLLKRCCWQWAAGGLERSQSMGKPCVATASAGAHDGYCGAGGFRELSPCPGAAGGAKGKGLLPWGAADSEEQQRTQGVSSPCRGRARLKGAAGEPLPVVPGLCKGKQELPGREVSASQGSHLRAAVAARAGRGAPPPGLWGGGDSHRIGELCPSAPGLLPPHLALDTPGSGFSLCSRPGPGLPPLPSPRAGAGGGSEVQVEPLHS